MICQSLGSEASRGGDFIPRLTILDTRVKVYPTKSGKSSQRIDPGVQARPALWLNRFRANSPLSLAKAEPQEGLSTAGVVAG